LPPLLLKQLLIPPHYLREIHAAAGKRPPAEVMHERVAGDHGPVTRLQCPPAIVIILEAADPKLLVQEPDPVDHLPADEQAEAHQPVRVLCLLVVRLAPVPGEAVQAAQVVICGRHLLLAADLVGARPHQPDPRIAMKCSQHPLQPAGRDHGVVIEQQHLLTARRLDALVGGPGKATVVRIGDKPDIRLRFQESHGAVGRAVVHDNQLIRRGLPPFAQGAVPFFSNLPDALQAASGIGELVMRQDHDGS
jgi:hypothetical protein